MFTNTSFDALTKTLNDSAEKFSPAAAQEAMKPVIDNAKAWGDLAQKQAQVATAAVAESVESIKSIKEPQAAFEVFKSVAENCIAMATKNFKDVTALSLAQFNAAVASFGKNAPAPAAAAKLVLAV